MIGYKLSLLYIITNNITLAFLCLLVTSRVWQTDIICNYNKWRIKTLKHTIKHNSEDYYQVHAYQQLVNVLHGECYSRVLSFSPLFHIVYILCSHSVHNYTSVFALAYLMFAHATVLQHYRTLLMFWKVNYLFLSYSFFQFVLVHMTVLKLLLDHCSNFQQYYLLHKQLYIIHKAA